MFCMNCGTKLPDKAKFCFNCGDKIEEIIRKEHNLNDALLQQEIQNSVIQDNNKVSINQTNIDKSVTQSNKNASILQNGIKENINLDNSNDFQDNNGITPKNDDTFQSEDDISIKKENQYIEIFMLNDTDLGMELHTFHELEKYKIYLKNNEYVFPLEKYNVIFPMYVVNLLNIQRYFEKKTYLVLFEFEKEYKKNILDTKTFYDYAEKLYNYAVDKIIQFTMDIFIASDIFDISKENIRNNIEMGDTLATVLNALQITINKYISETKTQNDIFEMNNMMHDNEYSAAGFGFSGVIGGMFAAEMANAVSKAVRNVKVNGEKEKNLRQLQEGIDDLIKLEGIMKAFLQDIEDNSCKLMIFYESVLKNKGIVLYEEKYLSDCDHYNVISENIICNVTNREQILNNLSQCMSYMIYNADALKFLTKIFYSDKKILNEIQKIAEFMLYGNDFQEWIDVEQKKEQDKLKKIEQDKRKSIEYLFDLPEKTSQQVQLKIENIEEVSKQIGYDAKRDILKLKLVLKDLKKKESEEPLKNALRLPDNNINDITLKINIVRREAEKIDYDVKNDIDKLMKKKSFLEKQEREAAYKVALNLPENSLKELENKIYQIKQEAEKIGYNYEKDLNVLEDKKRKFIEAEKKNRLEELKNEIVVESGILLYNTVRDNNVIEYIHGIYLDYDNEEQFKKDVNVIERMSDIYSNSIQRIREDESPIIYYDDTFFKNGNDSFMITDNRMIISNMGRSVNISLTDIKEYTLIEKTLSPGIKINGKYKISLALAGKKNVKSIFECIKKSVKIGIIISSMKEKNTEDNLVWLRDLIKSDFQTDVDVQNSFKYKECEPLCSNCGCVIKPGKKFCSQCGFKI